MAQVDSTSFNAALKAYYTDEYVRNLVYEDNPLFAMLSKFESWTGSNYTVPIQYGISSASRSADVTVSLARKDTNKYKKFEITEAVDDNAISISRLVMKKSGNNRGAFFTAKTREVDGMLQALINSCSHALYRNGGGAIGQVNASGPVTTTVTLLEPEDIVFFEAGMNIQASAADGTSGTLLDGGATGNILSVNRETGAIVSGSNWTAASQIPSLAASSYLFPEGDFGAKLKGLQGWCPNSAPTAGDSFYGVDRSVDTRLSGLRVDVSAQTILGGGRKAASRLSREGGKAGVWFMSPNKRNDLVTELDNKVQYTETGTEVDVGFTAIKLVGYKKPILVYEDHNCPDGRSFMFNMDDFKLLSMGPVPEMIDEDGVSMLRESTNNGFEIRAEYIAALACHNTKNIVNLQME